MNGLLEADRVAIVQWAERRTEIARVYLYGSRARGDHHAASDIDLAIMMDAPNADKAYAMWSASNQISTKLPTCISQRRYSWSGLRRTRVWGRSEEASKPTACSCLSANAEGWNGRWNEDFEPAHKI